MDLFNNVTNDLAEVIQNLGISIKMHAGDVKINTVGCEGQLIPW